MTRTLLPLEVAAQAGDALAWLRQHAPAGAKLTGDTRRLAQGDVFFAYVLGNARLSTDGRPHIAQAIARGASAVVFEADGFAWPHGEGVPHLGVPGLHQLAGPKTGRKQSAGNAPIVSACTFWLVNRAGRCEHTRHGFAE